MNYNIIPICIYECGSLRYYPSFRGIAYDYTGQYTLEMVLDHLKTTRKFYRTLISIDMGFDSV